MHWLFISQIGYKRGTMRGRAGKRIPEAWIAPPEHPEWKSSSGRFLDVSAKVAVPALLRANARGG